MNPFHPGRRARCLLMLASIFGIVLLLVSAIRPSAALAMANADTTTGLVGRWSLNDGANPTADSSGNARHAALSGSPAFTADTPATLNGTALDFDGTNDYLTLGGAESAYDLNVISIALWINVDAFTSVYQAIIAKGDDSWRIQRNQSTNRIHFATDGLSNVVLNSTIDMNDNQWHHVVAVFDGSTKYLYIDGSLNASASATGTINNNNFPVTVGMNNQTGSRFFDGQMDDIRVYSRALSAADVAELYAYTNSAPTAADDPYAATEDTTLTVAAPGVLANDTDPDSDILTPALVAAPASGALHLNIDGSFVYTPTANFSGTDAFTYSVYDAADIAPAGYWKFDDGVSPTADASGNGRAGTLLNGAAFVATVPISLGSGMAVSFDGSNDRVDVSEINLANTSFSVALWVKRSSATGGSDFVVGQGTSGTNNVLHIGFRNTNQFTCAFWNNDLNTTATYTDTDWHHWACTYDSATRQRTLYRDGVAVASDTASAHYQGTGTISIGSRNAGADPFPGLIDDVQIYQSALSATAIASAMAGSPGTGLQDTATVTLTVNAVNDLPVVADDAYATVQGAVLETKDDTTGTLTTTMAANNGQDGNMFNLTAGSEDITLTGFDVHIDNAGTYPVAVYYKQGGYLGSEQTPAAWTLLGTASVTALGTGNLGYAAVGGLTIPAGETYGLYVTVTNTSVSFRYTNGASTYSDGYLTFTSGTGQAYPFGAVNTPRTWNGAIHYAYSKGVLSNDSDVEADLSATLATAPANGELALNSDGTFVYTPTVSFVGQDTFAYIANDGVVTDTATVTVTVAPAPCTVESSGDHLTDYASADAGALQAAAAANPGATLKVAGTCAGVQETGGLSQTLYLDGDLTIQGGYTQTSWLAAPDPDLHPTVLDAEGDGRVIRVDGAAAVTLADVRITNGSAESGAGMLLSNGAAVTATNTLFAANSATVDGGAIWNSGGTLAVVDSTFAANTTAENGTINAGALGATTITSSSFYTNTARRGGGLYVDANGAASVANSTFAYNQATEGGGIHSRGALTVTHTTLGYNTATFGSAIHNWQGRMAIYNNLMGDNSDQDCLDAGTLAASVNNLIEGGSCGSDLANSPGLEALGDHGGETWTIALGPDSAAANSAAGAYCPASDQRGMRRPQGEACDRGAYEAELAELTIVFDGAGAGSIESFEGDLPPIACDQTCTAGVIPGRALTLAATPATGSTFAGWSGACSGTGECAITVDAASILTATFTLNQHALAVTPGGTGSGVIASDPAGIDCGGACSAVFDYGTVITLTATPAISSTFAGWGGACSGSAPTCVVTMDQARQVTATFALNRYTLSVTRDGNGSGTVTSSSGGIDCGATCSASFDHGDTVILTAAPVGDSIFAGWSGACSGSAPTCAVTMDQARSVTASFTQTYRLFLPVIRR